MKIRVTKPQAVSSASVSRGRNTAWPDNFDFAVGFSRQPLPIGNRFTQVTNTSGPGIKATDATAGDGFELAKLRPETLKPYRVKLPPTANVLSSRCTAGSISITESARAGFEKITNGVKQKLPSARRLGMESFSNLSPDRGMTAPVANRQSVQHSIAPP